ncbi:ATP-binding protein [Rhodococcus sp. NCIMB 12038]|uniref:ATP-binding protein n=1 Tax=Rhodococcus sp. NCIMB 12038 TaxID=933800 RepID=UPI000B3C225D|nr:SbcC/MukB-like Walker B domain-containing protein [Rhodococcus sp. NCIMB 12038]OUS91944.1 hypothetical protein CA951_31240 [Rhodococcus sp. NCIMB 12038]
MAGLFSTTELANPGADSRSGYRLERLEVYNWGTFDRRMWALNLDGHNGLLTGDIGSGKSTMVDAVTTLLMPAHRISYNKAAGADTRERSLRSYVLGYYKSERSETTGTSRPVGIRSAGTYSVILGVFRNRGYNSEVTLAQVFWIKNGNTGQPDRFFVTADADLTIAAHFADFGSDIVGLKKKLRRSGARLHEHFPEYSRDFRRQLGIESEQALDLFHQTVSMKAVGNLNDFVRSHMLEPFDSAAWTAKLVAHFDDLTKAHDAVRRAREQLADIEPILAECGTHEELTEQTAALAAQRSALRYYFAEHKSGLLTARIGELDAAITTATDRLQATTHELAELRDNENRLRLERAGHGGDRLAQLERDVLEASHARDERRDRQARYAQLAGAAGLDPVRGAEQFAAQRERAGTCVQALEQSLSDQQNRITEIRFEQRDLERASAELNTELVSLRERRSNIPARNLTLRESLCTALGIDENDIPFAGELIQVRPEEDRWAGAAERLLRGFGLSLLVSQEHYRRVSDWIDAHHLGTRVVYYRVPATVAVGPRGDRSAPNLLLHKIEIKDGPFYNWLERELAKRADLLCVDSMDEFRRADKAITRSGQIRTTGGRHEKNDTTRIDDRSSYILGWTNDQKIDALLTRAQAVATRTQSLAENRTQLQAALDSTTHRRRALDKLLEIDQFKDIDWESMVNRIATLEREKAELEASSRELERIGRELDDTGRAIAEADARRDGLQKELGRLEASRNSARAETDATRTVLREEPCGAARAEFDAIDRRLGSTVPTEPDRCDARELEVNRALTESIDKLATKSATVANRIVVQMGNFRKKYPAETAEMDDNVASAAEYRELHRRLVGDDLPRFETDFKEYLNTNTIRDVAGFHSQLNRQVDLIRERIDRINESLVGINYNPGRYIRLEGARTPNTEIREFITDLRECTDSSIGGGNSEQYSEAKFLQVKQLIERFKGREGQTESDRAWARRVTDVRNWFMFSASERWREDDTEHENYTDSGGKSGGQKEKLAYTILAASLAYQFKLEWGATRSKTFRFAVIDEAFGRGSDDSTKFALELFRTLGLQLLIVTPLQKIHVIEPYVSSVGFVDNPDGNNSRLQSLTIEQYREQQRLRGLVRVEATPGASA